MSNQKKTGRKPYFVIIYLFLICVAFLKVYPYIFDAKLDFSGDNAAYYMLGNSIAQGDGYRNIDNVDKPQHGHFPPGYPLIISGVIKLFPNNIVTVKNANGFFLLISIILCFFICKNLTENIHLAFTASILFLLNAHFLKFSTIMMSEIPYMMFHLGAILLWLNVDLQKKATRNWQFILLILLASFAFHIRTIGVCLFGGIFAYLLLKKKWQYALVSFVCFAVLYLPWKIRDNVVGIKKNNYIVQLAQKNPYRVEEGTIDFNDWVERISVNSERYVTREIPDGVFSFRDIDYKEDISGKEWLYGVLVLLFIGYGLYRLKKMQLFFLLTIASFFSILLNWPQIWNGTRFVFPLLPLFLIFILWGIYSLFLLLAKKNNWNQNLIAFFPLLGLMLCYYYVPSVKRLNEQAKGFFTEGFRDYIEMAKWAKTNLPEGSVVSARKPQLFYLYSNKFVCYYQRTPDAEELLENLKEKKVTHVVVDQLGYSSTSRYLVPAIQRYPEKFQEVAKVGDPNTYIFKYRPDLGYFGSFGESQKREGYGKFVWDNGQHYEGNWKNGVREGTGVLHLVDGKSIHGFWQNDILEGPADIKDENGTTIQQVVYKNNQVVSYTSINN